MDKLGTALSGACGPKPNLPAADLEKLEKLKAKNTDDQTRANITGGVHHKTSDAAKNFKSMQDLINN